MAEIKFEEKKLYNIKMAGLPLRIRSSHDEEVVNQLVSLVNKRVNGILEQTKGTSYQNALLLVALNLAEELTFLKRRALSLLERIESQADDILTDLESSSSTALLKK